MCCSKEVVMNQKSALNKESYASCLIVGIMAMLSLIPFWVAVVWWQLLCVGKLCHGERVFYPSQ